MSALDLVGALIWISIIGASLAHAVWSLKADRRRGAHCCTRCGRQLTAQEPASESRTMCARCCDTTQRNYWLGSSFFYAFAALVAILAPFVMGLDYRRFGAKIAVVAACLFMAIIGVTVAAAWGIRYFGRRLH